uniref:Uncharacterized protein n=1 Tax=Setaria digitata TaxID=48799 RepID=A0A915PJ72_9BILA
MLIALTLLLQALLMWNMANSLECYTGFSIIRGQTVGTTKEVCSKQSDSCYRAMADVNLLSTVKKAGCSTLRCYLNRNKCVEQQLFGNKVMFCCCDDRDLCNERSKSVCSIAMEGSGCSRELQNNGQRRVIYFVHPNMKVTREIQIDGKSIETKYAGEYMYMSSEGQAIFINYAPNGRSHYNDEFPVHTYQVHTPTTYDGDDCLNRRWAEVIQKLAPFALNNKCEESGWNTDDLSGLRTLGKSLNQLESLPLTPA